MIELLQITNDAALARRCDGIEGMRLWVDLERMGKAERQAGRDTFISTHEMADVARVKAVLRRARLMVRVNPLNEASSREIDEVLARGADQLMLPMFDTPGQLREFCRLVDGRAPVTALLETAGALDSIEQWAGTPGLAEVFIGLNDLHLSLGLRFMFEPLASGVVERVAGVARGCGLRFGFGGIAKLDEGLLAGRDVLAEHVRIGSQAVILSRTFHRGEPSSLEAQVAALRLAEQQLSSRVPAQVEADRQRIAALIGAIAQGSAERSEVPS